MFLDPFKLAAHMAVNVYMTSRALVNVLFTIAVIIAVPMYVYYIPERAAKNQEYRQELEWREPVDVTNMPGTPADRERWVKLHAETNSPYALPNFMIREWEKETGLRFDGQYRGGTLESHRAWHKETFGTEYVEPRKSERSPF